MTIGEEVTLGNLITIAGMVIGGAIAWAKVKGKSDEHDRRLAELENSTRTIEARLQSIESNLAGIKTDIAWICEGMRRQYDSHPSRHSRDD